MPHPDFDELIARMDETAWRNMRQAVETGRWPDGHRLPDEQRVLCMRAVLAWEARFWPPEQRTGYIRPGGCHGAAAEEQPVTLREQGDDPHA